MRRIAIINQKGGVGKTTTTANLGAALAEQGRRVVLVDMDAQANLSLSLGIEAESGSPTSYSVLVGDATFAQALRATAMPNVSLVASHIDLSGAELELAGHIGREFLLRDALSTWEDEARATTGRAPADYVLFDCPPSLGLLSINALATAGEVLITLQTEFLALQGMSKLVEVVQILRKRLNPELVITGILPCLYESRLKLSREVLGEIRRYFPGQVFPVPVRANVKLAEAPSYGQTIFQYAPDSIGAMDYRCAAREVIRAERRDKDTAGLPAFREEVLAGVVYKELLAQARADLVAENAAPVAAKGPESTPPQATSATSPSTLASDALAKPASAAAASSPTRQTPPANEAQVDATTKPASASTPTKHTAKRATSPSADAADLHAGQANAAVSRPAKPPPAKDAQATAKTKAARSSAPTKNAAKVETSPSTHAGDAHARPAIPAAASATTKTTPASAVPSSAGKQPLSTPANTKSGTTSETAPITQAADVRTKPASSAAASAAVKTTPASDAPTAEREPVKKRAAPRRTEEATDVPSTDAPTSNAERARKANATNVQMPVQNSAASSVAKAAETAETAKTDRSAPARSVAAKRESAPPTASELEAAKRDVKKEGAAASVPSHASTVVTPPAPAAAQTAAGDTPAKSARAPKTRVLDGDLRQDRAPGETPLAPIELPKHASLPTNAPAVANDELVPQPPPKRATKRAPAERAPTDVESAPTRPVVVRPAPPAPAEPAARPDAPKSAAESSKPASKPSARAKDAPTRAQAETSRSTATEHAPKPAADIVTPTRARKLPGVAARSTTPKAPKTTKPSARAHTDASPAVLRADDLPPLPPDVFEILSGIDP